MVVALVRVRSGWITCSVRETRAHLWTASTKASEYITVHTTRTPPVDVVTPARPAPTESAPLVYVVLSFIHLYMDMSCICTNTCTCTLGCICHTCAPLLVFRVYPSQSVNLPVHVSVSGPARVPWTSTCALYSAKFIFYTHVYARRTSCIANV